MNRPDPSQEAFTNQQQPTTYGEPRLPPASPNGPTAFRPAPEQRIAPRMAQPMRVSTGPTPSNGLGIGAMVVGILGVLVGLIPVLFVFSLILGAVALLMGLGGRRESKRYSSGHGMAIAGIVLGLVALGLGLFGLWWTSQIRLP